MKRLEYIDSLRGLAILLVVFMHVPQYGWGQTVGGWYMTAASMLAVPLFFFISGFLTRQEFTPPTLSNLCEKGTCGIVAYHGDRCAVCDAQ